MEKQLLKAFSLLALTFLLGCSPAEEEAENKIEGGQILDPGTLQKIDDRITGTGAYRFDRTMTSLDASGGMELKGHLPRDNSEIKIIFFSSRPLDLMDGVHISLFRQGSYVRGTIENNKTGVRNIDNIKLMGLRPGSFEAIIDIHAFPNFPRIFIFPSLNPGSIKDFVVDSSRIGDLDNLLANSPMPGLFTGVILKDATVSNLQLREALTPRSVGAQ